MASAIGLAGMRQRRGLSRQQLADHLGFSEQQVARLESGEITPTAPLRLILMRYFDCDFSDLFQVLKVNP